MTNVWNCMTGCQTGWLSRRLATLSDSDWVCVYVCVASLCAQARSLYMASGACSPTLFLLAQKRATKATTCSKGASRAERHPHPMPSPQRKPLFQPRSQPFSLSCLGGTQTSVEDTVKQLFFFWTFQREKSLFSWSPFLKLDSSLTTSC